MRSKVAILKDMLDIYQRYSLLIKMAGEDEEALDDLETEYAIATREEAE